MPPALNSGSGVTSRRHLLLRDLKSCFIEQAQTRSNRLHIVQNRTLGLIGTYTE